MIVSASRRTDIPAFYAQWFMKQVARGEVQVQNPFNARQWQRVSLVPEDVDAIVFWTRNARPLMPFLPELDDDGYNYYFLYTVNGYGPPLEPYAPSMEEAGEAIACLAEHVGQRRIIWRYDPLIFGPGQEPDIHLERFRRLANQLASCVDHVIISLAEPYRKTLSQLKKHAPEFVPGLMDMGKIAKEETDFFLSLSEVARSAGLEIRSCADGYGLEHYGIRPGACIDGAYVEGLLDRALAPVKDSGQRKLCRCVPSKDIGLYDTCLYGCLYCYAGTREGALKKGKSGALFWGRDK